MSGSPVRVVRTAAGVREALMAAHERGARIGLVPTMGAFHEGHLTLFRTAAAECDLTVASLFVNPAQFGPSEDLASYPRDEAGDARKAAVAGVDLLFAPEATELYPAGFQTWVEVTELGRVLEGAVRPGHFRGVATVCLKLFSIVQPAVAYFGRKDAQQVAVLRTMARDLDLPLEIRSIPIVRDADGLALSSRNVFLSPDDRGRALALHRALRAGAEADARGEDPILAARTVLDATAGIAVDYVAIADLDGPTLAAAIRVGSTRLIDNVLLQMRTP
jgi:pantoate--beta-alanine ligase